MKLLQRIFGRSLSPAWEIAPGAIIWKLQPTDGGIIIGESRDVELKTLSLFAIRPATGQVLFSGLTLDEPWWIALEMTIGEIAIFHRFPRPDMPNSIGATAVDCGTGQVLWSNDSIRILCGIEEIALAQRGETFDWHALALIDARTGEILEEIGDNVERAQAFQRTCGTISGLRGWINSEELEEDDLRYSIIEEAAARLLKERRGPLEVAEYGGYVVIGAHDRSKRSPEAMLANLVDAHLIVIQGDRPVVHEIVTREAPGPSSDIFFIWNGTLIYIRDRRILLGINLTEG
ncbi:MAG: DUF4905 domain-containing protein [Candidatus Kapaibacterium sp.]